MNSKVRPEQPGELQEASKSVERQEKPPVAEDGLWAGMMTSKVFGGRLFPKES